jgi:predicted  nucleic acid-binding Zn-ribbon protein
MNEDVSDTVRRLLELNRLEDELEQLKLHGEPSADTLALIESLRANISVSVLMQHDRLRARGRKSLAAARHGVCSGCHMSLPVGTVNELKRQDHVATCDNCGRFVFSLPKKQRPPQQPELLKSSAGIGPATARRSREEGTIAGVR